MKPPTYIRVLMIALSLFALYISFFMMAFAFGFLDESAGARSLSSGNFSNVAATTETPGASAGSPIVLPTVTVDTEDYIELAKLIRVIDGDTIEVSIDGVTKTVRYIGMDTPERGENGYKQASNANLNLLKTDFLVLRPDKTMQDHYGRLLRYVWTAEGDFVNANMIANGWAQPVEYKPDVKHADEFITLAVDAANNGVGFWSSDASPDEVMPYGLITSNARLRKGPSQEYAEVGTYVTGTPVTIYGVDESGEWVYIRMPDLSMGWMFTGLLRSNVTVDNLEVSYEYATPTATASLTPTVTPTVIATPTPTAVVITKTTNTMTKDDEGNIVIASMIYGNGEYITIINAGKLPTDTSGWVLFAGEGFEYLFPNGEMLPGTLCRIYPAVSQIDPFCY